MARALPFRTNVLRILRHDVDARRVVLVLQGHMVAEWALVMEGESLELRRSGRRVVLDLSGVTFIGRFGLETLGRLVQGGVGIVGCSPLLADVLEQEGIEVVRNDEDANSGRSPGTRRDLSGA